MHIFMFGYQLDIPLPVADLAGFDTWFGQMINYKTLVRKPGNQLGDEAQLILENQDIITEIILFHQGYPI